MAEECLPTNGAEANNEGTIEIDRNLEISPEFRTCNRISKKFVSYERTWKQ